MHTLTAWFIRNPVAANLAMVAILACGWVVYSGMPREVFPDFSLDKIEVFTTYPGASPEDVERLKEVLRRWIEENPTEAATELAKHTDRRKDLQALGYLGGSEDEED